jgi:hypothetical protein
MFFILSITHTSNDRYFHNTIDPFTAPPVFLGGRFEESPDTAPKRRRRGGSSVRRAVEEDGERERQKAR